MKCLVCTKTKLYIQKRALIVLGFLRLRRNLHALHYHQISVPGVQEDLQKRKEANMDEILEILL